jgi:hypothetical protein
MAYRQNYPTQAEANAFCEGVNYVQDIDVDSEGPVQEGDEWVVYVTIAGLEDDAT